MEFIGGLLFGVGGYVLFGATMRLAKLSQVPSLTMAAIAAVGFVVNLISFLLLQAGA